MKFAESKFSAGKIRVAFGLILFIGLVMPARQSPAATRPDKVEKFDLQNEGYGVWVFGSPSYRFKAPNALNVVSSSGLRLASGIPSGRSVQIMNLENGGIELSLGREFIEPICFSQNEKWLLCQTEDLSQTLYDLESKREIWQAKLTTKPSFARFSPDNDIFVTNVPGDRKFEVRGIKDGKVIKTLDWPLGMGEIKDGFFSPNSRVFFSLHSGRSGFLAWDLSEGKSGEMEIHKTFLTSIQVSRDLNHILTGDWQGNAKLWKWEKGELTESLVFKEEKGKQVDALSLSPDGNCAYIYYRDSAEGGFIRGMDIKNDKELFRVDCKPLSRLIALDEKRLLALAEGAFGVLVYDAQNGKLQSSKAPVYTCMAYFPDGKSLAAGTSTGGIDLYDLETGKETASWKSHNTAITQIRVSPDGNWLASLDKNFKVALFDLKNAKEALTCDSFGRRGKFIFTFSQDSKHIVTNQDNALIFWTLPKLETSSIVELPKGQLYSAETVGGADALLMFDGKDVFAWDFKQKKETLRYKPDTMPWNLSLDAKCKSSFSLAGRGDGPKFYDFEKKNETQIAVEGAKQLACVIAPAGRYGFSHDYKSVNVVDLEKGRKFKTLANLIFRGSQESWQEIQTLTASPEPGDFATLSENGIICAYQK